MKTWIVLLRGINVGGHASLPMKDLKATLEALDGRDVQSYIQSGNVVLRHRESDAGKLAAGIRRAIRERHALDPEILVLGAGQFDAIASANPFPEAEDAPTSLHVYFLANPAKTPDLDKLAALKGDNERFELTAEAFYLHAPDGIGRSKLAEKVEKALGVPVTARNWRTVSRLREMAADIG